MNLYGLENEPAAYMTIKATFELLHDCGLSFATIARLVKVPNWSVHIVLKPEMARGRAMYQKALGCGVLVNPGICSKCGGNKRIHGHHADYSKPLNVVWLCAACHRQEHANQARKKNENLSITLKHIEHRLLVY